MDLKLFFDPVSEEELDASLPSSSFQKSIFINHQTFYELDGIEIAIVGLKDYRGAGLEEEKNDLQEVRRQLYRFSKNSGNNRILDLGTLRQGPSDEDTRLRLREVTDYLIGKNILPLIIGGSHDMDLGQYKGYESLNKIITWLTIDARFDLVENGQRSRSHLGDIIRHDPNYLFNYVHLGYQSYFVFPEELKLMENLYFEAYRLGELKEKINEVEPVIRDADAISFDLSAIRSSDFPGVIDPNPFGLSAEESCQCCWYAGLNDKLSSIGFYGYRSSTDDKINTSASVLATMMWYFIEGYYHRKGDINFMSNDYHVYEVPLNGNPESIRFFKSNLSEKWWMEIPDENGSRSIFLRNKMVPCSYSDYEKCLNGEIPERYMIAFSKINT